MENIRIIPSHEIIITGYVDAVYEAERRPHCVDDFVSTTPNGKINKLLPKFELKDVKDAFYLTTMSKDTRKCDNHFIDMSTNQLINCGMCDICRARLVKDYRYLVNTNIHIFSNIKCKYTCKTCKEMCAHCLALILRLIPDNTIKEYAKELINTYPKCKSSICINCLSRKVCPNRKEQHCPNHQVPTEFNKYKKSSFVQNGSYKTRPTPICVECIYNDCKYFFASYELPSISKTPSHTNMIVYGPSFSSRCKGSDGRCPHQLPQGLSYCSSTCQGSS
jgi:hypothetical protein